MKKTAGQSLIEVVFAIGIISLVVSGVSMLLIGTLGNRTKSFDRKKATELSEVVMERVIEEKNNNSSSFWDANSQFWQSQLGEAKTYPSFEGYEYQVNLSQDTRPGCGTLEWECATVKVGVGLSGDQEKINFNRFFSKK